MDATFSGDNLHGLEKSQSEICGLLLLQDKWTLTSVFKRAPGVSAPLFNGGGEAVRGTDRSADRRPSSS